MSTYVGVDGCKAGWFAVAISGPVHWSHGVFGTVGQILERYVDAEQVLIDVPIGLRDSDQVERLCDRQARRLLGPPRASSVFPAPSRDVLRASTYEEAIQINRSRTGRGISKQTWAIMPKIREVDELLGGSDSARDLLIEVHPELLFWSLNEGVAMVHRKKGTLGMSERLSLLETKFPQSSTVHVDVMASYLRSRVARDDAVDALAAAVAGFLGQGRLDQVPTQPELDSLGLPMRMVFPTMGRKSPHASVSKC